MKRQESETKLRVRETPDWRHHAADLEAEMLKRGMMFEVIDWSEDQATLPGLYPATSKQRWRALRRRGLPGTRRPANPRRTAFFACQVGAELRNNPKPTLYVPHS